MQNVLPNPAAGVPAQLLPHMHLVSKYRYPSVNALSIETVVNYLLEAPKIVRDLQPMHWTFLDAPADGTVLLVWQPLEYLGTQFASDGYVWADPEQAFNHDARGYTLEMYMHRSGFHPPNETVSCHSRKRYRLTPGKVPMPGHQQCDPSLWLIHYTKAERRDHYPASSIPVQAPIQNMLRERAFLQRQGQITRKEFMLHDKNNWPIINFPGQPNANPNLPPQQPPFGRGGPLGPAPPRGGRAGRPSLSHVEPTLEEEEDVSRGDLLDFLTPREISKMRYEQHHEWMEEIMASPYTINQIIPVELGIGRKGALEELTNGFFMAPTTAQYETSGDSAPPRVGKLEADKAESFRQNAEQTLAKMAADLEQMRKQHAKKMASLQKSSLYTTAERKLRNAVDDPTAPANENLRLERSRAGQDAVGPREKIDDIIAEVESKSNKKTVPISDVNCVERGGLEEKVEEPEPTPQPVVASPSPAAKPQEDVTMSSTSEIPAPVVPQQSTTLSPAAQPSPATQVKSPSPIPPPVAVAPETLPSATASPAVPPPTNVQNTDVSTTEVPAPAEGTDVDVDMSGLDQPAPAEETIAEAAPEVSAVADEAVDDLPTAEHDDFDIGDSHFDDMNTAGEAMESYDDAGDGDLDLGDLDDSAFGEAFHPPDEGS